MLFRLFIWFYFSVFSCFSIIKSIASENREIELNRLYKKVDHYADINDSLSLLYINKYIDLAKNLNKVKHLSAAYRRLGIYYFNKEDYSKALINYTQALGYDLEIGHGLAITSDYCNIGDSYYKLQDYTNALKLYQKAIDYYDNDKKIFPYGVGNVQGLFANVYLEQNNLEKAKEYCVNAIINLKRNDNSDIDFNKLSYRIPRISDLYILNAKINMELKDLVEVKSSLDSAKVYIQLGSLKNQKRDYLFLKEFYDFEVIGVCCENIDTTIKQFKIEGLNEPVLNFYKLLKRQAIKKEDWVDVIAFSDSISVYQSKIHQKERAKVLNKYLAQFETSKAKYETREAKLEAENQKQKVLIISGLFLGLLIVFVFILFTLQSKKKHHKQAMSLKDLKIDELLRENELENLQGLLAGQEVERKRIAQDLHDTIGGMLSTIKLHFNALGKSKTLKEEDAEIVTNADHLLDESCIELRRVSHDLNKASMASYGIIENLKTLKNALELTSEVRVNLIVDDINLPASSLVEKELFKVIQELLSNTLKHAQATEINIQLSQFDDEIQLIFEDNGIGFDVNKISRGLGLNSIQKRIAKMQGGLTIDSHEKSGTTFIFEIPIKS